MTTTQLNERIQKAMERITKKVSTISKKENLIEKKKSKVMAAGYTPDEEGKKLAREKSDNEIAWLIFDIESLQEDIERLNREIPEIEETISKYKGMLSGEVEKENVYKNLPEVLRIMEYELFQRWYEYDIQRKEDLRRSYREAEEKGREGHREWMRMHSLAAYNFFHLTDEQIEKDNKQAAKHFVLDLYHRIHNITGEITYYRDVRLDGHALNGIFEGKTGKVRVETIMAGGYNIQRLHLRCLVHEIN